MTVDAPIFFTWLAAAFGVGVYVFFRLCAQHNRRSVALGWLVCAVLVLMTGWAAYLLDAPSRVAIFTGLVLPLWLAGALLGLTAGMIWYRNRSE